MFWIFLITLLTLSVLSGFSLDTIRVSAVDYPAIMVVPESTWNESLTPGMNYTVSIYTNYTGDDVWSYQFTLYYNPNVLHGGINGTSMWAGTGAKTRFAIPSARRPMVLESETVYVNGTPVIRYVDYTPAAAGIEFFVAPGNGATIYAIYLYDGVVNGDLITGDEHPETYFEPGAFNNTIGKLGDPKMPMAYFYYVTKPPVTASGPGILANVTFTVVGLGFSDITIGPETILKGWDPTPPPEGGDQYDIINAFYDPDQIHHGFFSNIPQRHDVAVVSLDAPATAAVEQPMPINVTVANEGTYNENVSLTVYNQTAVESTVIDTTTFTLDKGLSNTFSFSWNTSGVAPGSYTINATATVLESIENPSGTDDELGDNTDTQSVTLQLLHDVAVVSLDAPATAAVEQPMPINVTVANEGSYDESVTLTVYNETTVIGSTSFSLAKGPTSNTSSFSWDTSGVAPTTYTINATATVLVSPDNPSGIDHDPADNTETKDVTLKMENDVTVVSVTAPSRGNVNDNVLINVTVKNTGSYTETFNVTTYYNETAIVLPNGKNYTTVTLAPAESANILFTWNTTSVSPGFYTIKAKASKVPGEIDLFDNTLVNGTVLVTIPGDVDGDGAVDTSDLIVFNEAYGSEPGDSNWDQYCDLNGDDKIDASDLFDLSKNYDNSI